MGTRLLRAVESETLTASLAACRLRPVHTVHSMQAAGHHCKYGHLATPGVLVSALYGWVQRCWDGGCRPPNRPTDRRPTGPRPGPQREITPSTCTGAGLPVWTAGHRWTRPFCLRRCVLCRTVPALPDRPTWPSGGAGDGLGRSVLINVTGGERDATGMRHHRLSAPRPTVARPGISAELGAANSALRRRRRAREERRAGCCRVVLACRACRG